MLVPERSLSLVSEPVELHRSACRRRFLSLSKDGLFQYLSEGIGEGVSYIRRISSCTGGRRIWFDTISWNKENTVICRDNMSNQDKNSVIDDLYYSLYGEHQTKEGQALERLAGVAFKLLNEELKVKYDQQVRAKFSNTVYQVDGIIGEGDDQVMVEAKDYTVGNKPVGRADLQKLEGALTDLDISEGWFISATDYTNRAKPYAESTKDNPKNNPISLYHVRPSTQEDEKGRIKTILVNIEARGLEFERGEYLPLINHDFFESIKQNIKEEGEQQETVLYHFYDKEGHVVETFENITRNLNNRLPKDADRSYVLEGKWVFSEPVYVDMKPLGRVLINAIKYKVPTYFYNCSFAINGKGRPVLLIKSEDGSVNKLFTDQELKKFKFENGEIIKQ